MKSLKSKKSIVFLSLLSGVIVGFINGFFGGGGGMIVVPLLIFLFKLEDKAAHATAILCILPLSITSSIIYITQGNINYLNLLYTGVGVLIGGILGAIFLKKINNNVLRIIFSSVMIIAGLRLMF